jgi:cell division topological specificity factor
MTIFNWMYRRGSAPVARDRLKVLFEHERKLSARPDLLNVLRDEILAVIYRHMVVMPENVQVKMDRGAAVSTLAIDIEIPS